MLDLDHGMVRWLCLSVSFYWLNLYADRRDSLFCSSFCYVQLTMIHYTKASDKTILRNICSWGYALLKNHICFYKILRKPSCKILCVLTKFWTRSPGSFWSVLEISLKKVTPRKKEQIFWQKSSPAASDYRGQACIEVWVVCFST